MTFQPGNTQVDRIPDSAYDEISHNKEDGMTSRPFKTIYSLGLVAFFLAASPLLAQKEFRGRLLTGGGPNMPSAINIRVIINGFTSSEEVNKFQEMLARNDVEGFYSDLRHQFKGELRFIGGQGMQIKFNAAVEEQTEKGTKIFLFTESRGLFTGGSRRVSGTALFLVLELDLDKNNEGEGRVYEDGRILFTPQGGIKMDSYLTTPKEIINVKPAK